MRHFLPVLTTLAVLALGALLIPFTGLVNVSAVEGHSSLERWYLNTLSRRSIQARADGISAPANLTDSTRTAHGARAFAQMCQTCHGAPGMERSVTGQGMAPQPPRLSETAPDWTAGEIYWILDNGIKMAGMPAYGPTHSDGELWELVAFVMQLPDMTPERYAALVAPPDTLSSLPVADDGHDHVH